MRIYFLRHGESEYNVRKLINSNPRIRVDLTDRGRKQALIASNKLKKIKFDIIFISEFLRTKETALIINKCQKTKIKIDKRINEIDVGFEGESNELYEKLRRRLLRKLSFKISKGKESFADVKKRLLNFIEDVKKKDYGNVLVVTHEVVVMVARSLLGTLTDEESLLMPVGNCLWFIFEV